MTAKVFDKIHLIVKSIPKGKVATYGQVASLAGIKNARIVGFALSKNHDPQIPCHRVVKKDGFLVDKYAFGNWKDERAKLIQKGISFLSLKQVNLKAHQWKK